MVTQIGAVLLTSNTNSHISADKLVNLYMNEWKVLKWMVADLLFTEPTPRGGALANGYFITHIVVSGHRIYKWHNIFKYTM